MITLRKLASLPDGTRGRKLLQLLAEDLDPEYERALVGMARHLMGDSVGPSQTSVPVGRARGQLRQRLSRHLGIEAADWDLQAPPDRTGDVTRFPFHVWLDDLRSPFNVGSILRTAEAYGFTSVAHSPLTPGLDHPRTLRTAMGAEASVSLKPLSLAQMQAEWGARPVFALELGGCALDEFLFPTEGIVLLGGEELGLSPEALAWADSSCGRVSLPLYGRKASLNVGVAFGVLASTWTASQKNLCPPSPHTPEIKL